MTNPGICATCGKREATHFNHILHEPACGVCAEIYNRNAKQYEERVGRKVCTKNKSMEELLGVQQDEAKQWCQAMAKRIEELVKRRSSRK